MEGKLVCLLPLEKGNRRLKKALPELLKLELPKYKQGLASQAKYSCSKSSWWKVLYHFT